MTTNTDNEQTELKPPDRIWLPTDTDADTWNVLAKNPSRNWKTGEPANNIEYARVSASSAAPVDGDLISRKAAIGIAEARLKDVPDHVDLEADRSLFAAGYLAAAGSIKAALQRASAASPAAPVVDADVIKEPQSTTPTINGHPVPDQVWIDFRDEPANRYWRVYTAPNAFASVGYTRRIPTSADESYPSIARRILMLLHDPAIHGPNYAAVENAIAAGLRSSSYAAYEDAAVIAENCSQDDAARDEPFRIAQTIREQADRLFGSSCREVVDAVASLASTLEDAQQYREGFDDAARVSRVLNAVATAPAPSSQPAIDAAREVREALEGMVAAFDNDEGDQEIRKITQECAMSGAKRVLGWPGSEP